MVWQVVFIIMAEERESLLKGEKEEKEEREGGVEERREDGRRNEKSSSLSVPILVWVIESFGVWRVVPKRTSYKAMIYLLTFIAYTAYHLSRKPFSVVKVVLCPSCTSDNGTRGSGWPPFDGDHGKTLLGSVDYSWLFAYAIAMFFSGQVADRVNLRFFLTLGMLGSAISVALLGTAYYANIHHIAYFIGVQIFGGIMQSTGWPGVVSVMSHWFGKQRRGLLMGIWNAHTSLGNILGTIIPSFWANPTASDPNPPWGLSFIVPSLIMAGAAMLVFLFLVADPQDVGLQPPVHHLVHEREPDETPYVTTDVVDDEITPPQQLESSTSEEEEEEKEEVVETKSAVVNGHIQSDIVKPLPVPRTPSPQPEAVGFFRALRIPGVIEYALALFFNKLVSYTFLFWLPFYVKESHPDISSEKSDWLATLFDVGGIFGGIATGFLSDILHARAVSCVASLILAVPSLWVLRYLGDDALAAFMILLFVCGVFINGPYAIITTAVSSDLGTHPSLKNSLNAKATVTAIIDGTGSLGAALGPLLIGWITDDVGWNAAFYLLMVSCFLSALLLIRLLITEVKAFLERVQRFYRSKQTRLRVEVQ